jgi:hypothetical protein
MELPKPTTPLTRSSARKLISEHKPVEETHAQDQSIEIEKIHTSPGEGERNVKRLNKQLREAHDLIIQLREENITTKKNFDKHLHECGPTISNAYAVISNAQSKLRRNALLHRQVKNLKRHNLSLRKENRTLKLRMKQTEVDDEARGKLDLLAEVAEI